MENKFFANSFARGYRHLYLLAGGVFKVNEQVNFRPSTLVKMVNAAPASAEVNAAFVFNDKLWLGAGFRTGKRIGVGQFDNQITTVVEYNITDQLRAGYSFDIELQRLGGYNRGSHEIMLGYNFSMHKTKLLVPRYF
jgi:type IX secretion system PorP/SprF family membrane protein